MRPSAILTVLALALIPAAAGAQEAEDQEPETISYGSFDVGIRGTSLSGDGARFERYRDLGDGLFLEELRYNREMPGWFASFNGDHVGRRDQRLTGQVVQPGRLKVWGRWDQIPMLLSRTTQTLFIEESRGVLRVPDAIQTQVEQGGAALITSIADQFGRPFDMKTRRHVAEGGAEYLARADWTVRLHARNIDRKGDIPFGGSFGHGLFVETPLPIQHRLTDVDGTVEYTPGDAMLKGGVAFSWFHNDVTSLLFDNPYRITDATNAVSSGRFPLPPSNSWITVSGLASYLMPRRTRVTAYVSTGSLKDAGDPIVPHSTNTARPNLPLDRPTVNGEARTKNVNLSLTSRPNRLVSLDVRYKYYDYDNQTEPFHVPERIAYDVSLSSTPQETEPFGVVRHAFDADVRYAPRQAVAAGIGFSSITEERTHRIFESTTDNVIRLQFDSVGYRWFTLRAKYEHAEKRGTGIEEGEAELIAVGEQPGMRHFDVAERDRNRVTLLGTVMAHEQVSLNLSVAAGRDDYLNTTFGLLDNKHRVYSFGVDATPTELTTFAFSYSYEDYRALSRSRSASRAPEQFNDPARNWSTDGHDRVHSVIVAGEIAQIAQKLDLRLSYDFNRARANYLYGVGPIADRTLPEESDVNAAALPPPTQLPPLLSESQRGSIDATYAVTQRLAAGLGYGYDRYRVRDFTLDAEANPLLARSNALLLGYVYRPYEANTVWARLIYRW
jgi:MtrB/PioB family decaheme-associated outer membrane protein